MHFPDQSSLNHVRDALWQKSIGATVMIGAGFSRNAERVQSTVPPSPMWRDVAIAMCHQMYPKTDAERRKAAIASSSETSGALRLAQEYKVSFGETELHSFLREQMRDDDFVPGRIHRRLLELPWRDVFTTNWDTLLERARIGVKAHSYGLVRCPEEIPLSVSPRIVKLHGSVDARFPLIFAEEDYRTYPVLYAPFVNTVQQAMMETVFCLIGFSGEDPNFLHWSGWVRDNLGAAAPKIYLAGWLGLSIHRRRMLESRNVVPIDLARHPIAETWPDTLVHEYSTDFILRTLENARPYDFGIWPSPAPPPTYSPDSNYHGTIERVERREPRREPESTSPDGTSIGDHRLKHIRSLIDVWRYNRTETYPGWLSAPFDVRARLWSGREKVVQILDVLPLVDVVERLHIVRETLWQWELVLEPLSDLEHSSSRLRSTTQNVLNDIDCIGKKIAGSSAYRDDWAEIEESWVAVAKSLVTSARLQFDQDEFDRLLDGLQPFVHQDEELHHHIQYERGLWFIYAVEFTEVEALVDNWDTSNCDPVWMMRKAALLFEIGRVKEADQLNMNALKAIRNISPEDGSVAMHCRESWALYCAGASMRYEDFWHASIEWHQRWDSLTSIKCNAPLEMRRYADAMEGESRRETGRPFDLGKSWGKTISFSRSIYTRWAASHRAIRGAEIAGLPPTLPGRSVASANLSIAATRLVLQEPELAARLVLRAAQFQAKGVLNYVVSRPFVARIGDAEAKRIADSCVNGIEFIRRRCAAPEMRRHWMERIPVLMESLSRLLLRLDEDYVDSALTKALGWYEYRIIYSHMLQSAPLGNVIARAWETLPAERRKDRLLDLLTAPIMGTSGFGNEAFDSRRYPDPVDALTREDSNGVVRTPANEARWSEVLALLANGMRGQEEARRRAARRMSWVVDCEVLTPGETAEVAMLLWGEDYESHCNLPTGTDYFDWAFMVMPEPRPGLAEQRFRNKWLSPDDDPGSHGPDTNAILWEVGSAVGNLQQRDVVLALSTEEKAYVTSIIEAWAVERVPVPLRVADDGTQMFAENEDVKVRKAIRGLQFLLLEVELSLDAGTAMYDKVQVLIDTEMPGTALLVGLLRCLPNRLEEVSQLLRIGLVSDDSSIAGNAAETLEFWLSVENGSDSTIKEVPIDLVREVGVIIATRRKSALVQALNIAKDVFMGANEMHKKEIGHFCAHGLKYLAEELSYDVLHSEDMDVPLLRWGCAQLSVAMADCGWHENEAITSWIEIVEKDPLPEIRGADTSRVVDVSDR